MRLGKAYSVYIPGESFIQYQLNTQAIRPDNFVAMAAYAEELGYIGNRDAITTDRPAPAPQSGAMKQIWRVHHGDGPEWP